MANRTAYLDYSVRGAETGAARVRTLSDALARQKREAQAAVPAMRAAQQGTGFFGAVALSSSAKVSALTNSLGPLGAGLGVIVREAPLAASGLVHLSAQTARMGLLSRASNIAIMGGVSAMAAGGVAAVAYADNIIRGADAYQAMTARIRIFSEGQVDAAQNERALYATGVATRQGVQQLTTLYTRLTPAVLDAGRAQADALKITELTSKALLIQGATVREAEASTVQFAQALSSGVLRGDELRSLMETSPQLLRYIAAELEINGKVGVAFGQLRSLGEAGLLTTNRLMDALMAAQPAIEADFINAPKTAQQSWVILGDTINRAIGQVSASTGLQSGLVSWLDGLTKKLDEFRAKALEPDTAEAGALEKAEAGVRLIGDALDTAMDLAGGVAENFDLIVTAGQGLIALKLGEVMAGWFGVAAAKAREMYEGVQRFRANGMFIAGAAGDQTGAAAAINARAAAESLQYRATTMATEADVKARIAAAARAAADHQVATASTLKATAGAKSALVTEAEALATTLSAQAERAEAQAKAASTSATNLAAAASARNAIAQEAELAVTNQVNYAQATKAAVGRGLMAVYGLLGGGIGLVTIALGALLFAAYRSEEAFRAKVEALRDAGVVSDELRAISDALASATWAEVPALEAAAQAHREKAAAAREDAEASLRAAEARFNGDFLRNSLLNPGQNVTNARAVNTLRSTVGEIRRDEFSARETSYQASTRALIVERRTREDETRTGRDAAGREISPQRRAENASRIAQALAVGAAGLERLDAAVKRQEAAVQRNPENRSLANGLTVLRRSWDAAAELANPGGPEGPRSPPPSTRGGGSSVSAAERAILSVLERVADAAAISDMMGRQGPAGRTGVAGGQVMVDGAIFTARSEDEARAAVAYREQIEAITNASDALIAKSGLSREALAAQAAQTFQTALASSQATEAERRWAEKMAEARGESLAVVQAEREVAEARQNGVRITEEAADAYVALVLAQERARKAEEALSLAKPVVQEVTRETLDGMGQLPERWNSVTGDLSFDFDAAMQQWADARERILAESEARIRETTDQAVTLGRMTREDADRAVAAARLAVEAESGAQISELWNRLREEDAEAWRARLQERLDQEKQLADSITGSLQDLAFGADPSDVGKRFMSDLLEAAWEELVSNPLNLMIRNWLRSMASGQGGGAGGLFSFLGSVATGFFTGSGSAPGAGPTGVGPGGIGAYADGGLPGLDLKPGMIRGRGGSREDRILAKVSPWEFISNADATRRNLPLLQALNAGMSLSDALNRGVPAFARGGLPGADDFHRARFDRWMLEDEDRAAARSPSASAGGYDRAGGRPDVALSLAVINQTSEPVQAKLNQTPDGLELILEPMIQNGIAKAGASGDLKKAAASGPRPRRR